MLKKFQHDRFGECELVRIEGVDWIVRSCDSGQLYRVPLSRRHDFVPIDASRSTSSVSSESSLQLDNRQETSSVASKDGEGVSQLLRALRNGNRPSEMLLRDAVKRHPTVPPRSNLAVAMPESLIDIDVPFSPIAHPTPPPASEEVPSPTDSLDIESPTIALPVIAEPTSTSATDGVQASDRRRLRRVFEALRNGLSPIHADSRPFAVGIEVVQRKVENLLADVAEEGGRAVVLRGAYGQGKTFCLQLLKQLALESGYLVATTEIDAFENQLDKPPFVYRSLMQNLTFPDGGIGGPSGLAQRTRAKVRQTLVSQIDELASRVVRPWPFLLRQRSVDDPGGRNFAIEARRLLKDSYDGEGFAFAEGVANEARRMLRKEVQCGPLAWLLSGLISKEIPELVGLLGCDPSSSASRAGRLHILGRQPRDWPTFSAGTQGDFGSHVLSGIGRLARFLGYRGLILILDEMEKWQDLDWHAQSRAGNLLGGLIWSAGAESGNRQCKNFQRCAHTRSLTHSARCGGYPFSTEDRCYLGVAIAMTPRGDAGPEHQWSDYGLLEFADLPDFTPRLLETYIQKVFPSYCRAYEIQTEMPREIIVRSVRKWGELGDGSTRTAIQSVMSTLDEWRESLIPQEV